MSRSREEELKRQLGVEAGAVRLEPVGHDRHWNRYWVLGKWDTATAGLFPCIAKLLKLFNLYNYIC